MQRWITLILGIGVVALVIAVTVKSAPPSPFHSGESALSADASADTGVSALDARADAASTAKADLFADPLADDAGLNAFADLGRDLDTPREGGTPLPAGSPRRVRFGIVLVQYEGCEDAPPKARSKSEARTMAEKLDGQAKTDFHAAVQQGDSGSADDIGFVQRGVLEAGPEYALFTLPVGGVSDVLDTPRGFWIAKRLE